MCKDHFRKKKWKKYHFKIIQGSCKVNKSGECKEFCQCILNFSFGFKTKELYTTGKDIFANGLGPLRKTCETGSERRQIRKYRHSAIIVYF